MVMAGLLQAGRNRFHVEESGCMMRMLGFGVNAGKLSKS
jgi:hypothetical protein